MFFDSRREDRRFWIELRRKKKINFIEEDKKGVGYGKPNFHK
jgi:hypothetical protein